MSFAGHDWLRDEMADVLESICRNVAVAIAAGSTSSLSTRISQGRIVIRFNCAGCGTSISAPDGAGGKRGKCVKCGHANMVPAADEPSVLTKAKQPIAIKPPAAVLPAKVEVMPSEPAIVMPPPPPTIVQVMASPTPVQVNQQVVIQAPATNGLGTAGFVCSLLGVLTCGLLSPIGLFFSLVGIVRAPRGMAFAGSVLGAFGSAWLALVGATLIIGIIGTGEPANQVRRDLEHARSEKVRIQPPKVVEFRELGTYRIGNQTKRAFLVPRATTPESLVPLAKELHANYANDTLHFFDDDAKYAEYADWDKHYASPLASQYPCPEEWAEKHFVASANKMLGVGWSLWDWTGGKMYAILE